jgi:hypothetical protein
VCDLFTSTSKVIKSLIIEKNKIKSSGSAIQTRDMDKKVMHNPSQLGYN